MHSAPPPLFTSLSPLPVSRRWGAEPSAALLPCSGMHYPLTSATLTPYPCSYLNSKLTFFKICLPPPDLPIPFFVFNSIDCVLYLSHCTVSLECQERRLLNKMHYYYYLLLFQCVIRACVGEGVHHVVKPLGDLESKAKSVQK